MTLKLSASIVESDVCKNDPLQQEHIFPIAVQLVLIVFVVSITLPVILTSSGMINTNIVVTLSQH